MLHNYHTLPLEWHRTPKLESYQSLYNSCHNPIQFMKEESINDASDIALTSAKDKTHIFTTVLSFTLQITTQTINNILNNREKESAQAWQI